MPRKPKRIPRKIQKTSALTLDVLNAALFSEYWEWYWGDQADAAWEIFAERLGFSAGTDWRAALPSLDDEPDPRLTDD